MSSYSSSIHDAASRGNIDEVKACVSRGDNVNGKDGSGNTPIVLAVVKGHLPVVEFLLNNGADAHAPPPNKRSAMLLAAVCSGNLGITRLLVRHGGLDVANSEGGDPLLAAVNIGRANIVQYLINEGAAVNMLGAHKVAPLHVAVTKGNTEIVDILLSAGADVNLRGVANVTPLIVAVDGGNAAVVKTLLDKGAVIDARSDSGDTALSAAVKSGKTEIVNILKSRGAHLAAAQTPAGCFIATACYGDINASEVLVLREYRDNHLLPSKVGAAIVSVYYVVSPVIARTLTRHPRAAQCIKNRILNPIVRMLSNSCK